MDQGLLAKNSGIYRLVKFFDESAIDYVPLRDPNRYLTYDHYISHLRKYFSSPITDGHFGIKISDIKSSAYTTYSGYNYIFMSGSDAIIDYELIYDIMRGMRKISGKWILDVVSVDKSIDVIRLILPFIHFSNSIKIQ